MKGMVDDKEFSSATIMIIQPTPNTTKHIAGLPTRLGRTNIDHEVSTIMQYTHV